MISNQIPIFNKIKWNANAKKIEETTIVMTDNLIEISLPYFVYNTKTAKAPIPMIKRNQAIIHSVIDGGIN